MKILLSVAALALTVLVIANLRAADPAPGPSIEGSYILDFRELPGGKQVRAPQIVGMMTFTKTHRNFNVYWEQDGKPVSISTVSTYTLSPTEYTEESIYFAANDPASGNGPSYETTSTTGKTPVTVTGDKIEFTFPLHGEPQCSFDKAGLTATRAGAFVDHWKKID